MSIHLTKRQSLWLGIGLLAFFFLSSAVLIASNSSNRIPRTSSSLSLESVTGKTNTPIATLESTTLSEDKKASGFVLNEFRRSLVKDGKVSWEIIGDRGVYSPDSSSVEITNPKLTLASKKKESGDSNATGSTTVTAERAILTLAGTELANAELYDNVVVVFDNETTLRTSKVIYSKADDLITVPVYVEIENSSIFTSGQSMRGFVEPQDFTLEGNVITVIKPKKKDP